MKYEIDQPSHREVIELITLLRVSIRDEHIQGISPKHNRYPTRKKVLSISLQVIEYTLLSIS